MTEDIEVLWLEFSSMLSDEEIASEASQSNQADVVTGVRRTSIIPADLAASLRRMSVFQNRKERQPELSLVDVEKLVHRLDPILLVSA